MAQTTYGTMTPVGELLANVDTSGRVTGTIEAPDGSPVGFSGAINGNEIAARSSRFNKGRMVSSLTGSRRNGALILTLVYVDQNEGARSGTYQVTARPVADTSGGSEAIRGRLRTLSGRAPSSTGTSVVIPDLPIVNPGVEIPPDLLPEEGAPLMPPDEGGLMGLGVRAWAWVKENPLTAGALGVGGGWIAKKLIGL